MKLSFLPSFLFFFLPSFLLFFPFNYIYSARPTSHYIVLVIATTGYTIELERYNMVAAAWYVIIWFDEVVAKKKKVMNI